MWISACEVRKEIVKRVVFSGGRLIPGGKDISVTHGLHIHMRDQKPYSRRRRIMVKLGLKMNHTPYRGSERGSRSRDIQGGAMQCAMQCAMQWACTKPASSHWRHSDNAIVIIRREVPCTT